MSADGGAYTGGVKTFSGDNEDAKEYKRWKVWVQNKLLTLDKLTAAARGPYVYTLLSGKALECVEHLEPERYQKEKGEQVLFELLDARFPQKDVSDELGESLTEIFHLRALEGESLKTWISRASELFDRTQRKTSVTFPSEARGWVLLHRSGLSEEQKAVIIARAMGSLKREDVASAMRSCYPEYTVPKRRAGVSLVENDVMADDLGEAEVINHEKEEFRDVEQFLAEHQTGSLSEDAECFPEDEVAEVLAVSWREKRKELNKLQKNRRFSQAGDLRRSFRVEVEELKKKTKCHNCGQIGHWSRECRAKGSGKGASSSTAASASRPKESGAAVVMLDEQFCAACGTVPTMVDQLRSRAAQAVSHPVAEQLLVSSPGFGVLDSGCGKSIIGRETLSEFRELWAQRGVSMPVEEDELHHFKFGNGQRETATKVIRLPVILGGRSGSIKASIVQGSAPLLISRSALQALEASIDFANDRLTVFADRVEIPLTQNSAGQYVVSLMGSSSKESSVRFEEVMSTSLAQEQEDVHDRSPVMCEHSRDVTSEIDHQGLETWSRDDECLKQAITTGKQGPFWHLVKRRKIIDLDTDKVVMDELIDHSRPKSCFRQMLPAHVMRTRTEFMFTPQEVSSNSECLTVHQVRQLERQLKCHQAELPRKAGHSLLVAELFSPPRFTEAAEQAGFRAKAFDLKNGFDFRDARVRRQVEEELERDPPELLVCCPPCTHEGGWFNYNALHMSSTEFLRKQQQSRLFVRFSARLFKQQVQRGRRALFEHPSGSKIWNYPEIAGMAKKLHVAKCHMCRFGLRLPGSDRFIRKSTKLLVSHEDMMGLARECPGRSDPHHSCHDTIAGSCPGVGSISTFAGQYTPQFVEAVLETVPSFQKRELLAVVPDEELAWCRDSEVSEVLMSRADVRGQDPEKIKQAVARLHKNLGHPPNHDMVRILKHGQASDLALQCARSFECEFCKARASPQSSLPAKAERITEFNQQVGMDVKHLPGWKPNQKIKALNMVDHASCFQQVVPFFETETSAVLRRIYSEHWVRWAGPPGELILDPAQTNLGENMQTPTEYEGTVVRPIAAEAHWQLGRTERHGGWFQRVLERVIDEQQPRDKEEWETCVRHAHVKNTMIQNYGMTPSQFVFGRNPTIPGDLLSEPLQVVPATAGLTEAELARTQAIRTSAKHAVVALQDDKALRAALAARPRVTKPFAPGDLIAYWRQQKWEQGVLHQGGRWHGTGVVIGNVGRNVIIAHRKQIFRCAPEQLRYATSEERVLVESPQVELLGIKDLIEGGTFRSKQFIDLVPAHYPTQIDDHQTPESDTPETTSAHADAAVRHSEPSPDPRDALRASQDMSPQERNEQPPVPTEPVRNESSEGNQRAPEHQKTTADQPTYGPIRRRVHGKSGAPALFRPPMMQEEDFAELMREVVPSLIDQTMHQSSQEHAHEHGVKRSAEEMASEDPASTPQQSSSSRPRPDESEILSVEACREVAQAWAELPVEALIAQYMQKKAEKELPATGNPPALQEAVDDSKVTEWKTLVEKGALKIHYGRHAELLKTKFADRFIGSRFVITPKPLEEGMNFDKSDPSTFRVKGRWCLQGHLDPDLNSKAEAGLLQSPTLSQMARMLIMQLLASHKWSLQLGDIKGAFLEAGPLPERYRPLFASQPRGGVPGLPESAVIEVVGNVYGQNDAPVAWYRTFDSFAVSIGWARSKFDPCLYCLRDRKNTLVGIMGVHVDDTAIGGAGPEFETAVKQLKERFPYRKWRIGEGEFCGAYYKQFPDMSITMSQSTFAEGIRPANIPRGAENSTPLTEPQTRVLRAINGSLNWIASQSRPDLAVQTNMSQQAFPHPTIRHLRDANNAVKRAKQHKDLKIRFQSIPPDQLSLCCHSDAAWANVGEHTQAGYIIAFTSRGIHEGLEVPWTPAVWKSFRLTRAVSSTLGGESQAMAMATGTVEWLSLLLSETLDGVFELPRAREVMSCRPPVVATDCKSLFDHLVSPSSPTSIEDRRTSIDVVIIRESMKNMTGSVRWLPTDRMLADALTKDKVDPADLIRSCIRSSRYQISPEQSVLERQAKEKERRLKIRQLREQQSQKATGEIM